ncbi:MAG: hypothetical protein V4724_24775 [Pseudomonadota bacterium]
MRYARADLLTPPTNKWLLRIADFAIAFGAGIVQRGGIVGATRCLPLMQETAPRK